MDEFDIFFPLVCPIHHHESVEKTKEQKAEDHKLTTDFKWIWHCLPNAILNSHKPCRMTDGEV